MTIMNDALEMAKKAFNEGEIPVGAVIVKDKKIVAKACNSVEKQKDCTCHAEINVIKKACSILGEKILDDCEMYVTVEPCAMCAGAIVNARIKRLYIGTMEPKTGCCGSKLDLTKKGLFNHNIEVYYGFCEDECKDLIQDFFKERRKKD